MHSLRLLVGLPVVALVVLTVFGTTAPSAAQQETVLHSFDDNGTDGYLPVSGLTIDAAGNLYGTTTYGGAYGSISNFRSGGAAFKLKRNGGVWVEQILHNFGNGTDGEFPFSCLILDASGNLYGVTDGGGTFASGTAFILKGAAGQERELHNFGGVNADGKGPTADLIFDASGNLYGTSGGGTDGVGTVFELRPKQGGGWAEKVLYSFPMNKKQGRYPYGGLVFDAAGNLYGTTDGGGPYNSGTVFKLTPSGGGNWTEEVIYAFNYQNSGGSQPEAGLVIDAAGNLYGTTYFGNGTGCGGGGCGTAFELMPSAGGGWTEKVLHSFGNGMDGYGPYGRLVFDSSGNLYGNTLYGGAYVWGTIFKLTPSTSGEWTETIIHNFGSGQDGQIPRGSLTMDASGNLYGTTYGGGTSLACGGGCGTVFEIKP